MSATKEQNQNSKIIHYLDIHAYKMHRKHCKDRKWCALWFLVGVVIISVTIALILRGNKIQ